MKNDTYDNRGYVNAREETKAEDEATRRQADAKAAIAPAYTRSADVVISDAPRVPRVGDVVLYMGPSPSPLPLAAIMTQVDADGCYLAVFSTTNVIFLKAPYCGDSPTPGCWSWPVTL